MSRNSKVVELRLIEAMAGKLADDVERGKLWPGEYNAGIQTIAKALQDAGSEPQHG